MSPRPHLRADSVSPSSFPPIYEAPDVPSLSSPCTSSDPGKTIIDHLGNISLILEGILRLYPEIRFIRSYLHKAMFRSEARNRIHIVISLLVVETSTWLPIVVCVISSYL